MDRVELTVQLHGFAGCVLTHVEVRFQSPHEFEHDDESRIEHDVGASG